MSTPRETPSLPAHLPPFTVEIPRYWTPEEALAVFELIDDLRDKLCTLYGQQLQDLLRDQHPDHGDDDSAATLDDRTF